MTTVKNFVFKGLNTRSSKLMNTDSSDLLNVELNPSGELVKRRGFGLDVPATNILDIVEFKSKSEIIGAKAGTIAKKGIAGFADITKSYVGMKYYAYPATASYYAFTFTGTGNNNLTLEVIDSVAFVTPTTIKVVCLIYGADHKYEWFINNVSQGTFYLVDTGWIKLGTTGFALKKTGTAAHVVGDKWETGAMAVLVPVLSGTYDPSTPPFTNPYPWGLFPSRAAEEAGPDNFQMTVVISGTKFSSYASFDLFRPQGTPIVNGVTITGGVQSIGMGLFMTFPKNNYISPAEDLNIAIVPRVLPSFSRLSSCEYGNNFYFCDTTYKYSRLMKYDGLSFYSAGGGFAPNVYADSLYSWGSANQMCARVVISYFDNNGNQIFSDYSEVNLDPALIAGGKTHLTISNIKDSLLPLSGYKFYVYLFVSDNQDYGFRQIPITVDSQVYPSSTLSKIDGTGDLIDLSYGISKIYFLRPDLVGPSAAYDAWILNTPMDEIYDTTLDRADFPIGTNYVSLLYNFLVTSYRNGNVIRWGNLEGPGIGIENWSAFGEHELNDTGEGAITSLYSDNKDFIVLKERQIYYLNGNLQLQSFVFEKAKAYGVGSVCPSIIGIDGSCMFISVRGIFMVNYGQRPVEMSDVIESIFQNDTTGLVLANARFCNSIQDEKVYVYIPAALPADDIVLVYDYYYKEWFLYKGINARNGFIYTLDKNLFHCDGTNILKRSSTYSDYALSSPLAIRSYYKSFWDNNGGPSFLKKHLNLRLFSLGNTNWTAEIKTQRDWDDNDSHTDETLVFDSSTRFAQHNLNNDLSHAMRFWIENNVINEGMLLTGFEYEVEFIQKRMKA